MAAGTEHGERAMRQAVTEWIARSGSRRDAPDGLNPVTYSRLLPGTAGRCENVCDKARPPRRSASEPPGDHEHHEARSERGIDPPHVGLREPAIPHHPIDHRRQGLAVEMIQAREAHQDRDQPPADPRGVLRCRRNEAGLGFRHDRGIAADTRRGPGHGRARTAGYGPG